MSEHYVRSILERLKFAKSYINWSKFPMEKSRINGQIKMCEHYLKQDLSILPRNQIISMLSGTELFLKGILERLYLDIGNKDAVFIYKKSGAKNFKNKSKRKSKKKSKLK